MTSSSTPHEVAPGTDHAVSPPSTIQPAPTTPAPVQEKQTHSYYGPQSAHQPPPTNYYAQYPQSYGQHLQTYAPPAAVAPPPPVGWQPGPQQLVRPEETVKWRWSLTGLHASSFLFALIDIALSLSLLRWGLRSDAFNGNLAALALYVIVTPVMALLWSGAELITRLLRTNRKGITPGAHVGCCLIIWLAAAITGGMLAALAPWITGEDEARWSSSSTCYNSRTGYYEPCDDVDESRDTRDLGARRGIFFAITAFQWLLWAVNFTLFVIACIDTHRRNMSSRPVVYVPYWAGPAAQGWQALPQQNDMRPVESQNIPMQTRNPSGGVPAQSGEAASPVTSPAPAHQVQEYYNQGTGVARYRSDLLQLPCSVNDAIEDGRKWDNVQVHMKTQ